MSRDKGTTVSGVVNPHGQEVIRSTGKIGTDHGQYVYEIEVPALRPSLRRKR